MWPLDILEDICITLYSSHFNSYYCYTVIFLSTYITFFLSKSVFSALLFLEYSNGLAHSNLSVSNMLNKCAHK